jgi:cation diffusion facilitator family transporter
MEQTRDIKEHYGRIRHVLVIVLALNWTVALAKIIFGHISRSSSVSADGYHSLADGASNIIGLIGIHLACQPKDTKHPYGHKKYETLFALAIAAMLFYVSFSLVKEGIHRIAKPIQPEIDPLLFAIMLITLGVNIVVMRYEYAKGRFFKSDILVSDSMHTRADIFTSVSVIITLVAITAGFPIFDAIATIVIALMIAWAGLSIARESSNVLCDTAPIVDVKKIEEIVLKIKGVRACHKIRTRGRPDDINLDLHVQVHPDMHVDTAHKVSYAIEEEIKKSIPEITDVLVHIEPQESSAPIH